jgi:hypothetical protein
MMMHPEKCHKNAQSNKKADPVNAPEEGVP